MAERGEEPLRDEGASEVGGLERYGPQHLEIEQMIMLCDHLQPGQVGAMARAHAELGVNRGAWEAWQAARKADGNREERSGAAAYAVEQALKLNALFIEDDEVRRASAWAANDAGLAVSTRDLIGTHGYGMWDYDKLISAWRAGAGLEP